MIFCEQYMLCDFVYHLWKLFLVKKCRCVIIVQDMKVTLIPHLKVYVKYNLNYIKRMSLILNLVNLLLFIELSVYTVLSSV